VNQAAAKTVAPSTATLPQNADDAEFENPHSFHAMKCALLKVGF
jgi:hypothetical protein